MQTIVLVLNPGELANPDLDLRYSIPDRIEEVSNGLIQGNGYDFIDAEEGQPGPWLGIWLETEDAEGNWPMVQKLFEEERFQGNDLSQTVRIYSSEHEAEEIEACTLVFPK